jgi:hypothetical protein
MSIDQQADEIERRGFDFLDQERWGNARGCFQEMLELPMKPVRRVKVLMNIMGTYEKEGNIPAAIASAEQALDVIEDYNLYEATVFEGARLRGSLKGHLTRLGGKLILTDVPRYSQAGPIEMNLSFADQVRAHFATASLGAALGFAIGSQIPYPQIQIGWLDGGVESFSVIGAALSWLLTNNILEMAAEAVHNLTGRDERYCLQAGLNLLTVVGGLYIVVTPFILPEVIQELAPYIIILLGITVGLEIVRRRKGPDGW